MVYFKLSICTSLNVHNVILIINCILGTLLHLFCEKKIYKCTFFFLLTPGFSLTPTYICSLHSKSTDFSIYSFTD